MHEGYVELHCHSCFSFREGASTPLELVLRARELGYPALALTDHDRLAGVMEFAHAAEAWGVRPIYGAEITLRNGAHLTLLAETPRGYANLSRLLTLSHLESEREHPALDPAHLEARREGLLVLTGCREGLVSRLVAAGHEREAAEALDWLISVFGRDRVWVELQDNLVYGDERRIEGLTALARRFGVRCVATNNAHYHVRERHRLQDVLVAVRHRTTLDGSQRKRRPNSEFYLKPPEEMRRLFSGLEEAVTNTLVIADRCRVRLPDDLTYRFPGYTPSDGRTADAFLADLCHRRLRELYGAAAARYEQRLNEELRLITDHGQAGLFLSHWDLIREAHERDFPVRGRGSSVGSLVCYLLGLSGIDPLKYDLFAGRFLNEAREREDPPDIDLDFARDAREEMFRLIFERYGPERAALVANQITYRYPQAVRDVGKALGLPAADIDRLAKRLRGRFAEGLEAEMRKLPDLAARMSAPPWQQFVALVEELRGMPRHLGQHSGGVVITSTDAPLAEQAPVERSAIPGRYIIEWDKDSCGDAGLIKMDLLGYPSLSQLRRAVRLIEERRGVRVTEADIPLDDPAVYEMIQQGDTIGIVQIQSRAQIQTIKRLTQHTRSIHDLVILVALIRPGPIQGGAVNPYIERTIGKQPVTYDHPCLEPVLAETKGVIVFQEQVLQVAMAIAGFTAGQAESLRRAMSRKRSREAMEALREAFLSGAHERGIDAATAQRVFEKIVAFAEYGFPKAHAAAMAETACKLAWVKRHYPEEFYCALLNEQPMGFYSPEVIVNDARRHGVEFRGVDVNESRAECYIDDTGTICLGFNYVKGLGEAYRERLEVERANGPYRSLWEFWRRTRLPREPIERLIEVGAFAWTGLHERELLWQLGLFYEPIGDQLPLPLSFEADIVSPPEMTHEERVAADLEWSGIAIRGRMMDLVRPYLHEGITSSRRLEQLESGTPVTVAGIVAVRQAPGTAKGFVFHTLEDDFGMINIITRPSLIPRYPYLIQFAPALIVHGRVEREQAAVNVIAERFEPLAPGSALPDHAHSFG